MRASDLLKCEVVNEAGDDLGHVHDVRFEALTEDAQGWSATAILVGRGGFAARLGYVHGTVTRPWIVGAALRAWSRHGLEIPWDRIVDVQSERIVVSGTREDFDHPRASDDDEAAS